MIKYKTCNEITNIFTMKCLKYDVMMSKRQIQILMSNSFIAFSNSKNVVYCCIKIQTKTFKEINTIKSYTENILPQKTEKVINQVAVFKYKDTWYFKIKFTKCFFKNKLKCLCKLSSGSISIFNT